MNDQTAKDFAASLVEMARAYDENPTLHARVKELEAKVVADGQTIAAREERIHQLKLDQDALYTKLRSVEAERDDASFRLLESEDRNAVVGHLLRSAQVALGDALKAVEPKAEPIPEPVPMVPTTGDGSLSPPSQGVPDFTGYVELKAEPAPQSPTAPIPSAAEESAQTLGATSEVATGLGSTDSRGEATQDGEFATGQSETLPTVPSGIEGSPATTQSASTSDSAGSLPQPSSGQIGDDEQIHGPYYGRRYYGWPALVTLEHWLAGGGTKADYEWRPWSETMVSRASHMS